MRPDTTYHQSEALARAREDIAMHKAEIADLRRDIAELKAGFEAMQKTLVAIQATLSEARGGWRALMLVGGAGASLGAALSWLIEHVIRRGP